MANLSLSSSSGFCFADFGFVADLLNIFCVLGGWNLFFCTVLVLPCKSVCTVFCVMFLLFLCSDFWTRSQYSKSLVGDDTFVRVAIEVNEVSEILYIFSCFGGFEAWSV